MGGLSSTITQRANAAIGADYVSGDPRLVYVWSVVGYNKDTSSTSTLYFSDIGFSTGASDTPAHTHFPARLVVPNISASLVGGVSSESGDKNQPRGIPGLRNFAPPDVSVIKLINSDTDPDDGTGPLDDYGDRSKWSFSGRACKLEVGATDLAYPSQFETVLGLEGIVAAEPTWDSAGNLIFVQEPPLKQFGKPYKKRLYGGWGAALSFDGSTNAVSFGDNWSVGQHDTCLEVRASWPDNANQRRILQKRATLTGGTDAGYSLYIDTSKQLIFSASDGTSSGSINMGSASAYDDDTLRMFSVNFNWGTEIEAFVTTESAGVWTTSSLGTIDISSWTGAITNTQTLTMGADPGKSTDWFDGSVDEFRVWRKVRTSIEINDSAQQSMAGSEPHLVALYKNDDRSSATTVWQEVVTTGYDHLVFSAAGHEVSFGNVLNMTASDDFTFGIWFNTGSVSGTDFVFGNRAAPATTNTGYQLQLSDSSGAVSGEFSVDDGTSRVIASSTSSNYGYGVWHFLCGRCDRTAETVECIMLSTRSNDLEVGTSQTISGLGSLSNANSLVAGRSAGGTNVFAGQTGHGFFVNGAALTNAEIKSLARYLWDVDTITMPGDGVKVEATYSGSSFWQSNEGSGATVADSWSSNDGTITGAAWGVQDATISGTPTWVSTYEGDGAIGGVSSEGSITGTPKPESWGRIHGAPGVLVDQNDNGASATPIYQYADPDVAASKSVDAAYSGGLLLTEGALNDYTADVTNCVITLTAAQDEQITLNIKGYVDGSNDVIQTTADIGEQVLANVGETTINSASFTSVNTTYGYQVGLAIPPAEVNTEDVIDALLRPSVWGTKNAAGEVVLGVFKSLDGLAADFALTTKNIKRNGVVPEISFPPASRIDIGFRPNPTPLTSFLGGVSAPEQIRQSWPYRWTGSNARDIETAHLDARPVRVTSRIHHKRDAKIEAERLVGVLNRPLMILRVELVRDLFQASIGDVVSLTYPRFGFGSGKNFLVVGYSYPTNPSLQLWGPFAAA